MAVTLGGVNLGSDGDGTTSVSGVQGPTVVLDLQAQVDSVSDKINGGAAIESADLEEISRLLALLKNSSAEDLQANSGELEAILPDTLDILTSASDDIPRAAGDQAVIDAIDTTVRDIAAVLDFDLPGPITGGPDDTPEPTAPPATGAPADAPEPTPAATGDATPVATATPEPVQAPTPTSTADDRAPPGFLP